MLVAGGATNVTTYFAMRLAADGTAATGLTATGFDLQYVRSGAAPSTKVDASAGTAGGAAAHSDNTVVEPDATDQPGLYRIDWPNAAFAAGVREVILTAKVATAFTEHLRVTIDGEVNVVEWAGTDVATPDTAGYPVVTIKDGTGTGEINTASGAVVNVTTVATTTTNTDMVAAAPSAASVADAVWDETMAAHTTADTAGLVMNEWQNGGRLDLILDIIAADTTTDIPALLADIPTVSEFNARTLAAADYFDPAADAVANVTLVATTTTNTDMVAAAPTAAANADAVWDETMAGHSTADTAGLVMNEWQDGGRLDNLLDGASAPSAAAVADAVWDETLAGHVTADTAGLLLNEWQDGGRLDLILDIVAADTTTDIPALLADIPTVSEFNARTLAAASYFDPAADTVANVTTVATTTTNTDMVAAAPTAAANADAVWDETLAGHVTADTAGLLLNEWQDGGRLDLILDTIAVDTTTDIPALIADVPTVAEFNARTLVAASYFDPAADAVANVTLVATTTTNTDMVAAAPTAAANADAVWDEAQSGHVGAGTFGVLASEIATLQTEVDGIQADTEDLQTQIGTAGAGLTDLGGMSTAMKAEVNVEALDVLVTDTHAEPGQGLPAATASLRDKIGYLYKAWRNKSDQTSSLYQLYNDDASTVDQKATVSDDTTTATKGEIATGP